jgi:glycosyltransferase involved in cell wall biosynthesis
VVAGLDARERSPVELDPLVDSLRPDLVHLHNLTNPAVLEWGVGRGALLTLQDHRAFCPSRGKWTADGRACTDPMDRETCRGCFEEPGYFEAIHALTAERLGALRRLGVVVLSEYMRDELIAVGVAPARIAVVPPFVHGLEPGDRPPLPRHVLFAGRLVEAKGVRDAIEAWRLSELTLPLVAAGAGPLRPELERAGARCLGWLSRPRLAEVYRDAAALLLPSRWQEPFGLAGLEALSLGTPVVAWQSGGVREWHPAGDRLVAWGDRDGLARELRRVVAGGAVSPPPGFDRESLTRRLDAAYARLADPP